MSLEAKAPTKGASGAWVVNSPSDASCILVDYDDGHGMMLVPFKPVPPNGEFLLLGEFLSQRPYVYRKSFDLDLLHIGEWTPHQEVAKPTPYAVCEVLLEDQDAHKGKVDIVHEFMTQHKKDTAHVNYTGGFEQYINTASHIFYKRHLRSDYCQSCQRFSKPGLKFKHCGRCMSVSYCSQNCQKLDWPMHKVTCKLQRAMKGGSRS